ncbi:hypothetical protein N9N67_11815 [Bacteriovoracaceae bacterium]|nr:hypothetical protein [Bacteriovoracaceae bacterium]
MKIYLVNTNFEQQIRNKNLIDKWCQNAKEIEYLFFYLQDGDYFSQANYDRNYLDRFPNVFVYNTNLENKKIHYLWGNLELRKEKLQFSSKVKSHNFLKELINSYYPNFDYKIVNSILNIDKKKNVVRSEYGYSGVLEKTGQYIVTNRLHRTIDLSLYWKGNEKGIYQNYVSLNNRYFGTKINLELETTLIENFLQGYELADTEITRFLKFIDDLEKGYLSPFIANSELITMDFFIYIDQSSENKIYPFCEFNTRMTMGILAHKLNLNLSKSNQSYKNFLFLPRKISSSHQIERTLSPENSKFIAGFSQQDL